MVSLMYHSTNLSWKIAFQKAGCIFAYFCGGHKNNFQLSFRGSFNEYFGKWIGNNLKILEYFAINNDFINSMIRCYNIGLIWFLIEGPCLDELENLKCTRECYNSASVMAKAKSGVTSRIKALSWKSLYTHCILSEERMSPRKFVNLSKSHLKKKVVRKN